MSGCRGSIQPVYQDQGVIDNVVSGHVAVERAAEL